MVRLSFRYFVSSFVFVYLRKDFEVSSKNAESYFHVNEPLSGVSLKSMFQCAHTCAQEKCCSVKFNGQNNLCHLNLNEHCFEEPNEDGWNTMMRISKKKLFRIRKTWDGGQAFCMSEGGRLAAIRNEYEYNATVTMLKDRNLSIAWIGGSDIQVEGVFVWDGTSEGVNRDVKYWFPGQPDDGQGLEDCVVFKYDDVADNYKFNDIPCTANKTFLCEF